MHAGIEERNKDARESAQQKHISPAELTADVIVRYCGDQKTDVEASMQERTAQCAALFRPLFGEE